ncbi:MAG: hypothetical protein ACREEM_39475 [Blastocatellia bacterium]
MAVNSRRKEQETETTISALVIDTDSSDGITKPAISHREIHLYPHLESSGLKLERLQGPDASRDAVAAIVSRADIVFVTGVGHGSPEAFPQNPDAEDHIPIFETGAYRREEVEGKIFHLLSCHTGSVLGPDLIRNGCRAFFGYEREFSFLLNDEHIFFDCDSEISRAFAEGLTAEEVYNRVIAKYDRHIIELQHSGDDYASAILQFNRDSLCAPAKDRKWGDPDAKLHHLNY